MNKRNTLRRVLALLCCVAMLLPCVPATLAAEDASLNEDFESYTDQTSLQEVWTQHGNTEISLPQLSTEQVFSGKQSMMLQDTESNKSVQFRTRVENSTYPGGTEFIMTTKYYAEQTGGSGVVPYIRLYTTSGNNNASIYSTGKWDSLSVIHTTGKDRETLFAYMISNSATLAKVYFDDVKVSVLTEELALQYVEEKLFVPGQAGIIDALTSMALGLNEVDSAMGNFYGKTMKSARVEKGSALTKKELQACVDKVNSGDVGPAFESGFEEFASDVELSSVWTKSGGEKNMMKVATNRVFSGKQSLLMDDVQGGGGLQVKASVPTTGPAGTEYIFLAKYYVESNDNGTMPFIRLIATDYTTVMVNAYEKWDTVSTIIATKNDRQTMGIVVGSNNAPYGKVYWDDMQVVELTEELAVQYVNEKAKASSLQPGELMAGLGSKALGRNGVNEAAQMRYLDELKAAYKAKSADLTKQEIQNCVINGNMALWVESNQGQDVYCGEQGAIPTPSSEIPQGVSAKWISVSPANKNITVSNGVATANAIPTGADEAYSAVLRVTGAGKSVDVEYTIKLVNTAGLDKQQVEWARQALSRADAIGMDHTGAVVMPKDVTADGVSAQWVEIKSNPNNRLNLSGGTLSVTSLPSGIDFDEAVVVVKLTKGSTTVLAECRVVTYDKKYRILMPLPNASLESIGSDGMPESWKAVAEPTADSFVEVSDKEARTGMYSVRVVDKDPVEANGGFRTALDAVAATSGKDYVGTYWAKGMATATVADRAGAAAYVETNASALARKTAYAGPATPISADEWTQVSMRGTADAPYVDVMAYSYQATVMDMYTDDFLLWEMTTDGVLLEVDAALKSSADALYTSLGSKSLNVTGLNAANKALYFNTLNEKRAAKGSALTAAELAAGVKEANSAVTAGEQAVLKKVAAEIKTSQTIEKIGVISVPQLSDSSVTVKYTAVTGDGAKYITLTGINARVDSLPAAGTKAANAVMTLTLTKGSASVTVDVKTTLKTYGRNMAELIAAAKELDINDYLNGQKADYVTADLAALPASVNGIGIKWQILDSATLTASKAVSAQGKVTRPAYGQADAAVALRATLSKGSDKYEHDLYIIVPALGAEDARTVITRNTDFEGEVPFDEFIAPDGWIKNLKWADGPNEILTSYANVATNVAYTGNQSLRITANGKMASVQNLLDTTAQEGFTYTLETMAYTDGDETNPSICLKFYDNEGLLIKTTKVTYASAPGGRGVWKNLIATGVAPAGTSVVSAELDGGTKEGVTFFDDVRLREWPIVANGSFELGTAGWITEGKVTDGKLTLTAGQSAVSMVRGANRGVTYYLSLNAEGGKAALRFVDKDSKTLAEYTKDMKSGLNAFFAYAPANTAGVQVVLTGAMTADSVKITRSVTGTEVTDGDFEISANAGVGTPWDLTDATIGANTGKTGAGVTVKGEGSAKSTVIPVEDGKGYVFSVDVKGKGAKLQLDLFNFVHKRTTQRIVTSDSSDWTTLTISYNQLEECIDSSNPEHAYAQIVLTGAAAFDNVRVYSVSKTVSNASMENTKDTPYGTFPHNWKGYGKAATYVANQPGQFTEGVKGLAVELFGLGEGGIRSSMIKDIKSGKAYEATINAKGSGAKLSIEFWDKNFNKLGSESVTINSKDFKAYSVIGTAPSGTIYASLSVGGDGVGLVYADEATLYPVIRSIGTNLQLFLDNWLIKDSQNVKRTFHEGEKTEVKFTGGWFPMIQWDAKDQVYKMWHQVTGYNMMLRTSKDGINWSGSTVCYFDDGAKALDSHVVIDEDEPDPSKRYKAVLFNHVQSRVEGSYDYYSSADGVTWKFEAKGVRGQDVLTLAYDEVNDEYIMTYKISTTNPLATGQNKRTHSTVKSKDLINWTEGVRQYSIGTVGDAVAENMIRAEGYGTGMYPLGDSYVAMNWRFLLDDADSFGGLMDSTLLFSRDLNEDWQRMYDENGNLIVGIPRGKAGEWDDAQTYSADTPTNIGDETWWYYAGWNGDHGTVGVPKTPAMAAMKWRRNGWASMDFSNSGTMTTEQFTLMGDKLHLNAKGDLTVELLDANGAVAATGKFSGDSVDSVITWDKSIAGQAGKVVSLRFTGSNAELYTIQWTGSIFSDVSADAWYHTAVNYAVDNGIMGGYGGGKFGPNDTLTRAMVIQMLYNKVGQPKITTKHAFTDVPADQWFNNAVTWGTSNGVMGGYGGGKFGPNDNVTIEQIAVILWNYSGNPEFNAELGDVGKYDGWAANGLTWARDNGILHGVNFKNATDNATRAQAAQMLTNYLRR